jgi:crooked neck
MERKNPFGGGRSVEVKNKAPAPVQTTAEQLLRIATELQEREVRKPDQAILDSHELAEYHYSKRKKFEERIRMVRDHAPLWIRYAEWEERQNEFERARSIFERAIDLDFRFPSLWIRYAEMEMRNRFINHARNVFERAVGLLPRIDQLWLK